MIPSIGLMIGGYILLRCLEICIGPKRKNSDAAEVLVSICAVITFVTTAICIHDLFSAATKVPTLP